MNDPAIVRSLRTADFLYIRNFAPDRWPLGAPYAAADARPDLNAIDTNTRAAFPDMDASPTKTWLIARRDDARWKRHYDLAFAKRPAEALYDVRTDPDQVNNLAADPKFAAQKTALAEQLMKILTDAQDPRVMGDGGTFDRSLFSDPEPVAAGKAGKNNKGKKRGGAHDADRTRDLSLTKGVLYH